MEGLLFEPALDPVGSATVREVIGQLRQEVAELRAEVAGLRRENLELRQQAGYWKSRHGDAVKRIAELEREVAQLRGENRKLQAELFGRKSEKPTSADRSNQLDDPSEVQPPRRRGQRPDRQGPKRRDYSHLPAREEIVELPESERVCPQCGLPLTCCGTEDSEQIEIDVRAYRRVLRRRRYQRTCGCSGSQTVTAPPPPKLIPKGLLGVSVWVEILLDKFASYRATERLLESWRSLDLDLAAGTVADGLQRLEPLFQPIYAALTARNQQAMYTQADETRWLMFVELQDKTSYQWWLWVFGSDDSVVYVIDPFRSHAVPQKHFAASAGGVLMVDRYSAYKAMPQVKDGTLKLAFCWAHVRRDFVRVGKGWPELKDWALGWLKRIRELYRLNRLRLQNPADTAADLALRQALAARQQQAAAELANPSIREPVRKVLTSLQEHWPGLTLFVDDPRIPMDNNASERRLRGPALGRKNYYGSGALWSGRLAAMLFSILATLKLWRVNPRRWLQWFLQSCAAAGGQPPTDIQPFLPWNLTPEQWPRQLADDAPRERPDTG
jgi:transposase